VIADILKMIDKNLGDLKKIIQILSFGWPDLKLTGNQIRLQHGCVNDVACRIRRLGDKSDLLHLRQKPVLENKKLF